MAAVTFQCPGCSKSYRAEGLLVGHTARCRRCGQSFPIRPATRDGDPAGTGPASPPTASRAAGPEPAPPSLVSLAERPAVGRPAELPEPFGRYRILRTLGRGGMGAVYLAHDSRLDRSVALKVPEFTPAEGPEAIERFYREARAAATLDHPNLCPVYDVDQIDGIPYLTMPYLEGKPLSQALDPSRPVPPRQAAAVVRKLALALYEAHSRGIIHRDLKPANIMADRRRGLVIMDFGLARRLDLGDARLTKSGALLGTPLYMAPEQVRGDHAAIGPAADIYSLGVILYEMLAGRRPFDGPASLVLAWVLTTEPPRPSEYRPDLDPALEAICRKAMAKAPEDRYATMAEFAAALAAYLAGQGPPPPPEIPPGGRGGGSEARGDGRPGDESLAGQFLAAIVPTSAPNPLRAPPPQGRGAGGRRPPRRSWVAAASGAVALAVLGIIILVRTDRGAIRIEVNDPDVEVRVDGDAVDIRGLGAPISLRTGEHRLVIMRGGEEILAESFAIHRGANPALKVALEPEPEAGVEAGRGSETARWVRPPWIEAVADLPPEPEGAAIQEAERTLVDEFKRRLAEGKLDDRAKLAQELLDVARTPAVQPTERAARLKLAARLAAEAGAFVTAIDAIREQGRWFDVDMIRARAELLGTHARFADTPPKADELACAALATGFEALRLEDYRFADALARLAASAAEKAGVGALADQATFLAEEVEAGRAGFAAIRRHVEAMRRRPDDVAANAAVGRFLCLVKNDWRRGLPMLARGGDARLRPAAEKELHAPADAPGMVALGDAWWDLAEQGDADRLRGRRRARHWYLKALAAGARDGDAATLRRIRERLARVPAREFRLRIRAQRLDYNVLSIGVDGLNSSDNRYSWPRFSLNHLRWETGAIQDLEPAGAARLLPDDIDFTKAESIAWRTTGGEWQHYGRGNLLVAEDHLRLGFIHWPSGAFDAEWTIGFGRSAAGKDRIIAPEWDVKYYTWARESADDADYWETLFRSEPLARRTLKQLCDYWGQDAPADKVPADYFALVATAEVELPEGTYRILTDSDDGIRVFVDGEKVLESWPYGKRLVADLRLREGRHALRVEYNDATYLAHLVFHMSAL